MKTITLFDICQENYIPTVRYSANPETIARWGKANTVAVHDGYAYVEPDNREYWAEFDGDKLIYSSMDMKLIDFNIYQIATILHHEHGLNRFKLYFFETGYSIQVSGIN